MTHLSCQILNFTYPGVDGFTINMIQNGFFEGRVELLGQTLAPLFA